jgi:DNA mismatch repair protein MutS
LRKISHEGKSYIQSLQEKEIARTGIHNLKVRYNKVFGYYIEVSKGNLGKVPEDYIRKQTLVNAERFITPELKEYEEKVLGANEKINILEHKIFLDLRERVISDIERIQRTAKNIALLDVICCLAHVALLNNYCRPEIIEDPVIEIKDGRHPVVEKMSQNDMFIPNDTLLDREGNQLLLITGPNMGGKSTYLRQVALIVLMAHIGSFVPARSAKTCITDRIFTRVGASDNLVRGQSTFMVEMQEASNILKNATVRSLVILDEIGRGTSTYDGLSIAWAITEYLHDKIKAKTLFATHYHELINLVAKLPHAANYCVTVKEQDGNVVFLYKILKGGVSRSYGIEVARLAGLPGNIISRSTQILKDLEEGKMEHGAALPSNQMGLFSVEERAHSSLIDLHKKALDELRDIDINSLTPLQALAKLDEVKRKLPKENA